MVSIIIIRGAPGVGKSTLSKRLNDLFHGGVTIEVGPMLKMINQFEDGNSVQYSDTLNAIYLLTLNYLESGYMPIIIIGPLKATRIQMHFLHKLQKEIKYIVITLIATNEDLSHRIDKRSIGFKNKTVSYAVNDDIINNYVANEIRFNTSGKSEEEVFEEVRINLSLL